jgi:cytochrome c-type biogenesis protein CcmH/NrfF
LIVFGLIIIGVMVRRRRGNEPELSDAEQQRLKQLLHDEPRASEERP